MYEADLVANTVKLWLGNPISRRLLRWVSKRNEGSSKLEVALKKYVGENVKLSVQERLAYWIVKLALDKGSQSFGVSKEQLVESLKNPLVRRGISNVLEGIGYYGVQRPQTTAAPFLIVWNFTKQCNLRCKHCYENAGPKPAPDELTTEEAKKAIDEFAEAGVVALSFSGGEPLMRKDFFEVAKYAAGKEFYVSVATNGTLITEKIAQKMKDAGVQYAEISLDGFEKTHDEFRGIPGAWRRSVEGIKNCVKVGLDTGVATTATHYNLKEIPKLAEFVEKDLHARRFIVFNFIPVSRGKEIISQDLTPKEREELLDFLYSKLIDTNCKLDTFSTAPQYAVTSFKYAFGPAVPTHFTNKAAMETLQGRTKSLTEFIGGCGAGRLYCGMEPNGDIEPCVFIPIKVGNIREERLVDIWRNSPVLKKIRNRDAFKGCGECEYKNICGGCRARAYAYFNDLQGPDPGCSINEKYWDEVTRIQTT
ncbi:radical SAM/SPASM domain-containing protein [Candidatus Bathyarchaeota archaeon]|nr:MAG: radical SAM/SPASM domain-containing protein [Candidatus Bathyarchaeota archaeon]